MISLRGKQLCLDKQCIFSHLIGFLLALISFNHNVAVVLRTMYVGTLQPLRGEVNPAAQCIRHSVVLTQQLRHMEVKQAQKFVPTGPEIVAMCSMARYCGHR